MRGRIALIVGGGIGGLAAGVALTRAGWRARIFERSEEPRTAGFALSLAPNAMAALRELGLADRVAAEAAAMGRGEIRRGDGRVVKRFDVRPALGGSASVFALRPALHRTLLDAVGDTALALGREGIAVDCRGTGAVVTFSDGGVEEGDMLVGADGSTSAVRRSLHPGEPAPRPSGYVAVRGVAHGAAALLEEASFVGYLDRGVEAAAIRAGRDAVYWYVSMLAEDLPLVSGGPDIVRRHCAGLLDDTFRAVVHETAGNDVRLDELFDRDPLPNWGRGPLTLLGDAAHPMLPHTGQGAAQALEDAVALGIALRPDADIAGALRRYERVRSKRTASLVRRGRRIARLTTTRDPLIGAVRSLVIRAMPGRAAAAGFLMAGTDDPHRDLR